MQENPVKALNATEESAWRSLTYVANHLVRALGEDLAEETPVTVSEYVVLVHLSEAEQRRMRIGDLAAISALSPSRMSRLVDEMAAKRYVTKSQLPDDARCILATLTERGLETLRATYPIQLRNVRRRVFDHLSVDDVEALAVALKKIKFGLESKDVTRTSE